VLLASKQAGGLSCKWTAVMCSRQIDFTEGDGGETTFILAGIIGQLALSCLDYKKGRAASLYQEIETSLNRKAAVCPCPSL
jgi:hypothetical protein